MLARGLVARAAFALHVLSEIPVEECPVQEGGRYIHPEKRTYRPGMTETVGVAARRSHSLSEQQNVRKAVC